MLNASRPSLSPAQVRAVCAAAAGDASVYARVTLAALAGARPLEVEGLRVGDLDASRGLLRLRGGGDRTIRVAPSAVSAVEKAAAEPASGPGLLDGWSVTRHVQIVRGVCREAGVDAGVHELRQSAIAAVLEDGTPVHHIEAYFGVGRCGRPVREGYDVGIAAVLEGLLSA